MKLKKELLEKEIQKQILEYLWAIGAYAGKTKTQGFKLGNRWLYDKYLFVGFPDITFFYYNKLYFCEVKRKGNYLSKQQEKFRDYCKDSNINYILAYSIDDVMEGIKQNVRL